MQKTMNKKHKGMKNSYNKFKYKKVKLFLPKYNCIGCDFYPNDIDCCDLCDDFKYHFKKRLYIKVYEYVKGLIEFLN